MVLLRVIVLQSLANNVRIFAKHVRTENNGKADALSHLQFDRFRKLDPEMNRNPEAIPELIWPMEKIWLKD